ncbi:MAG: hypothetical protein ABR567_09695 [Myxococcales bacterium]|nr:hypothetical protein [Myxococcales bacterium]
MRRLALILLVVCACKRTEDEAARARIFSSGQPVGAAAEARQPIDARTLDADPALAQRVLHMTQSEIEQRLGSHRGQQRVQFAWFRGPGLPDGGSEVSLSEETTLQQATGGDFSVKLVNDHNQGLELVWKGGEVFVKSLYGPFHKRRTDRTDVQRVREQALSGLATFDRLARGLKLKMAGETAAEGRRVVRYTVTGFGARAAQKEKSDLPPVVYPDGKPDPDTARRLELWEKEEPTEVSGTLVVDAETGVPLACDLEGDFKVPSASKAGPAAELELHTVLVTTAVGKDPGIKSPPAEPEPSVPHAVKDPLRFLGKEPGAAPAVEEPEETEDEDETGAETPDKASPDKPAKPAGKPK